MKELSNLLEKIKTNPKRLVIAGLTGILLIALSGFMGSRDDKTADISATTVLSSTAYKEQLENQVKEAISHVTGGKVSVVITLDSDIEYIYASEGKSQSSEQSNSGENDQKLEKGNGYENSYVIVKDADGNETPLVVTAVMPNVKGAVVNCEGADDAEIKSAVTQIVMTALCVSEEKVCVLGYYQ